MYMGPEKELKPYVQPLPNYKDTQQMESMLPTGYKGRETRDSLMGLMHDKMMTTCQLLGYKNPNLRATSSP